MACGSSARQRELAQIIGEYAEHGVEIGEVWVSDEAADLIPEAQRTLSEACDATGARWQFLSRALNLVPLRPAITPA